MQERNIRLEENELMDLIFEKFKVYRFWGIKALKKETGQPEAHLKDVLSKVAELVKTGRAANHWTLKREYWRMADLGDCEAPATEEAGIAPEVSGSEDDGDEEMEDVI